MPSPTTHNTAQEGSDGGGSTKPNSADEKLLQQIRTRWTYMVAGWKKIGDAGDLDMAALGPDGPWDPLEREARRKANRPCIHLDQLNQYPNTLVNQFRLNPIGVKVEPQGSGASEETATLRGDRIRAIEHESDAMQAYETALRCIAERGYGVITLETEDIAWDSMDQRIRIVREPDPNAVVYDPDCREADSRDMQDGFKVWSMPISQFKEQFPHATTTDFNLEHQVLAPEWINVERQTVMVAKYSYFENTPRHIYWVERGNGQPPEKLFKHELGPGWKAEKGWLRHEGGGDLKILQEKDAIEKKVKRCITNGVEILSRADWPGSRIPIFPMLGKEKFIRKNGVTERILESQIRMAIDGQRGFDSSKTNQVETANMVPKATYIGYKGQFDTNTDWANINKISTPYAEVEPVVDGATGQVLPLPQRTDWNPQIEPMEIMSEAYRRAIQSAIGSHGFTVNDDTNIKTTSGIKALKSQSDVGNYHFEANSKVTVRALLREVNFLLDKVEDTDREVGTINDEGEHEVKRINAPYLDKKSGKTVEHRYSPRNPQSGELSKDASHEVVVFTGPTQDTQRDNASDFVDGLVKDPNFGPRVVDLAIKWHGKDLGTYAEQMAQRVTLPEFQQQDGQPELPPQVKQQLGQLQAQNKELTEMVQHLVAETQSNAAEIASKEKIASGEQQVETLKIFVQLRMKEIEALVKGVIVHEQLTTEENLAQQAAEASRQAAELAHEQNLATGAASAEQASQQSAQDHEQGLESQTQQAESAAAQQAQAEQAAADQAAAAAASQPSE